MNLTVDNLTYPSVPINHSSILSTGSHATIPAYLSSASARYYIATRIIALILNAVPVYLYVRHRSARTSFTAYVISLSSVNLMLILGAFPLVLLEQQQFFGVVQPKIFCAVFRNLSAAFVGWTFNSHFLIALNRFWAVFYPISYRNYHQLNSPLKPWLICLLMYGTVALLNLPSFILEYVRDDNFVDGAHCTFTPLHFTVWPAVSQYLTFVVPFFVCFTLYLAICYHIASSCGAHKGQVVAPSTRTVPSVSAVVAGAVPPPVVVPSVFNRNMERMQKSMFLTVSLLMLNICVTTLPSLIGFISLVHKLPYPNLTAVRTLNPLYTVFDPILFLISVKHLRDPLIACWTNRP